MEGRGECLWEVSGRVGLGLHDWTACGPVTMSARQGGIDNKRRRKRNTETETERESSAVSRSRRLKGDGEWTHWAVSNESDLYIFYNVEENDFS